MKLPTHPIHASEAGDLESVPECRVVILYDEVDAGKHATSLISRLAGKHAGNGPPDQTLWRTGMLEHSEWRETATDDILHTDILVIAAARPNPLSESVEQWLTDLIALKRGTPAAIVAILGLRNGSQGVRSAQFDALEKAAREAGLDFFSPLSSGAFFDSDSTIANIHHRAKKITSVINEILHHCPKRNNALGTETTVPEKP